MKKLRTQIAALALSLCVLVGCASKPASIDSVAARIEIAAETTTSILVEENSSWIPKLKIAAAELQKLQSKEVVTVADVVSIIEKLGVKELGSRNAKISLGAGRIIFYDYVSNVEMQISGDVKKIADAISTGITSGL